MLSKKDIRSMTQSEIAFELEQIGEKKFRAAQIYKWLISGVEDFEEMTDISKSLREKLDNLYFIPGVKTIKKLVSSVDGTVKYLYELYDGETIE